MLAMLNTKYDVLGGSPHIACVVGFVWNFSFQWQETLLQFV